MQTISNTIIGTLETVKDTIESRDQKVLERSKVFAPEQQQEGEAAPQDLDKFKKVSYELLDIGLFYTSGAVESVRSMPLYQRVDSVINLEDKFALVQKHGKELYTMLDSRLRPLVQNVFFVYDAATQRVTSFIRVIAEKQEAITSYVQKTYSCVSVLTQDTWMRLDFDNDGSVSSDDLKKSMHGLYDFLRNLDIIEATTEIKGKLYTEAIAYMQQELDDQKRREKAASPNKEKTQ